MAVPKSGCCAINKTGITIKIHDSKTLKNLGGKNLAERYDETIIGTEIFISSDGENVKFSNLTNVGHPYPTSPNIITKNNKIMPKIYNSKDMRFKFAGGTCATRIMHSKAIANFII